MSSTRADAARAPGSGRLRQALALCETMCDPVYTRADTEALRQQRLHRIVVDVVAAAGTIAILAGIAPVAERVSDPVSKVVESIAAVTALVAVVFGLYARSQRRWLLERHRAERLRALQHEALIALAADASMDVRTWTRDLSARVSALDGLTAAAMETWLVREEPAAAEHPMLVPSDPAVREFAALYVAGRLYDQCEYFRRRAERNERTEAVTRSLVAWLFFISVGAVLPASLIRILGGSAQVALVFVAIAAGAPALAGGIRLVRSAHEFARNATRFRTKYLTLSALRERLLRESNSAKLLSDLLHAEALLEAEHREWLRLMLDAEWYG